MSSRSCGKPPGVARQGRVDGAAAAGPDARAAARRGRAARSRRWTRCAWRPARSRPRTTSRRRSCSWARSRRSWPRTRACSRGGSRSRRAPSLGLAGNYLYMLTGAEPHAELVRGLNVYLNTVVDHGLNASTFTARVIASTGSDFVSAITGAIGALKGPLHGGAPGPALDMVFEIGDAERAEDVLREKIERGERLMGFGHRVYKVRDPRADVLAAAAERMFERAGDLRLYELARAVEATALRLLEEHKPGRRLQTNVEFYTALLLHGLGLETALFTPTFADRPRRGLDRALLRAARARALDPPAERLRRPRAALIHRTRTRSRALDFRDARRSRRANRAQRDAKQPRGDARHARRDASAIRLRLAVRGRVPRPRCYRRGHRRARTDWHLPRVHGRRRPGANRRHCAPARGDAGALILRRDDVREDRGGASRDLRRRAPRRAPDVCECRRDRRCDGRRRARRGQAGPEARRQRSAARRLWHRVWRLLRTRGGRFPGRHPRVSATARTICAPRLRSSGHSRCKRYCSVRGWRCSRATRCSAASRCRRQSLVAGFFGAFASQFWFLGFSLTAAANVKAIGLVEVVFAQLVAHRVFAQRATVRETRGYGARSRRRCTAATRALTRAALLRAARTLLPPQDLGSRAGAIAWRRRPSRRRAPRRGCSPCRSCLRCRRTRRAGRRAPSAGKRHPTARPMCRGRLP